MQDSTVPLAAIGLVATILGLVVTPLFALLRANTKAQVKMAEATERVAKETAKSATEAKQRNGHLAELIIQTGEHTMQALNKPVNVQTVETQVVREQK